MSVMFASYLSEPNQRLTYKEPCGCYKTLGRQNRRVGALMLTPSGYRAFLRLK